MSKQTALHSRHLAAGARMIDFFGYEMPLQYKGIIAEHQCVRADVGIFDLSHMGEIIIEGPKAASFLNRMTTNNVAGLTPGGIHYNLLLNDRGGVIDDILIYRLEHGFYLVVNAANKDKDYEWLQAHGEEGIRIRDVSDETALIAVQGPSALPVIKKIFPDLVEHLEYYHFGDFSYLDQAIRISRTGYTGEDGFELYLPAELAPSLWDAILAAGAGFGIQPIGLGARDTLRLEARMPLYGNELTEEITPFQAGLSRVVDLAKEDFIGKTSLLQERKAGIKQRLVGFELKSKGISRHGYTITDGNEKIGFVTSGAVSPVTGKSFGLGYINREAKAGDGIYITIRGQQIPAQIVKGRFYSAKRNK